MSIPSSNARAVASLRSRYYFPAVAPVFDKYKGRFGALEAGDHLTAIMNEALPDVEKLIQQRHKE